MTKIKFIDARFPDGDLDEMGIKRRFEGHLRKLRALRDGVKPQAPGDFADALRWEGDLSEVRISSDDRHKILRRAQYLVQRRDALSGTSYLSSDGKRKLALLRNGVELVEIKTEHCADEIATVTADGAYDTSACHDAIAARGAAAVIPPRRTARRWKPDTAGARARNESLRASKHLGRALWRNWSGYHRRSRVETKMNCVKLLGQRLISRDFDRQVAEVQIRAAVMNRFTALGIPVTVALG